MHGGSPTGVWHLCRLWARCEDDNIWWERSYGWESMKPILNPNDQAVWANKDPDCFFPIKHVFETCLPCLQEWVLCKFQKSGTYFRLATSIFPMWNNNVVIIVFGFKADVIVLRETKLKVGGEAIKTLGSFCTYKEHTMTSLAPVLAARIWIRSGKLNPEVNTWISWEQGTEKQRNCREAQIRLAHSVTF